MMPAFTPSPCPYSARTTKDAQQADSENSQRSGLGVFADLKKRSDGCFTSARQPLGEVQAAVAAVAPSCQAFETPLKQTRRHLALVRHPAREDVPKQTLVQPDAACGLIVHEDVVQPGEEKAEHVKEVGFGEHKQEFVLVLEEKNTFLNFREPLSPSVVKNMRKPRQTEPPREKPQWTVSGAHCGAEETLPTDMPEMPHFFGENIPATPCWDAEPMSPAFNGFAATPSDIGGIQDAEANSAVAQYAAATPSTIGNVCEDGSQSSWLPHILATPSTCRVVPEQLMHPFQMHAVPVSVCVGPMSVVRIPGVPQSWTGISSEAPVEFQSEPAAVLRLFEHLDSQELGHQDCAPSTVLRLSEHLSPKPAQPTSQIRLSELLSPRPAHPESQDVSYLEPRELSF